MTGRVSGSSGLDVEPLDLWSPRGPTEQNQTECSDDGRATQVRHCLVSEKTRRDRLKSAPYLRLKNMQINNYWKHLQKIFFSKKLFLKFFFRKKVFFKKSHNAEKLIKRPFRLIKRFYKPKTSKKCKGYPLIESVNFRKKVA